METKRRAWVKNAIIIFLAIMLILTFFSNTIMNRSLPEVAAQYTQNGSISSKIRTSAYVTANSKYDIKIDESRTVKSVAVMEGQNVQIGDVLFYLDDAESAELAGARETLAQLERQYELKLLTLDKDYYAEELSIKQKREQISEAEEILAGISENAEITAQLETQLDNIARQQKSLVKMISSYEALISKLQIGAAESLLTDPETSVRLETAQKKYDAAKAIFDELSAKREQVKARLEADQADYDTLYEKYELLLPGTGASLDSLSEQIASLEKSMRRAKEDYDREIKKLDDSTTEIYDKLSNADLRYYQAYHEYTTWPDDSEGNYAEVVFWRSERDKYQAEYDALMETIDTQKASMKLTYDRTFEDNNEQLTKLKSQYDALVGAADAKSAVDAAKKRLDETKSESDKLAVKYSEAEGIYNDAKSELEALKKLSQIEEYESTLESLRGQNEKYTEQASDINEQLSKLGAAVDEEEQKKLIANLKEELATMQHNLSRRREEDAVSDKREALEMQDLLDDINEQKALIKKYEANSTDAKITATVAGQVASLSISSGMQTSVGQTLCELIVTELGYSCEISLTNEQARRVRVGDEVDVTNAWWSSIKGNIINIRNDPKNPGGAKLATISLSGDVVVGQNLSLTIGEKGQTYDAVIPNSAIREDNNGKFVLVVVAKSSPLGNRYIAERYDVEVLASDETNSAVSGLIGSEFVITTSSAPLKSGDQVRMAGN